VSVLHSIFHERVENFGSQTAMEKSKTKAAHTRGGFDIREK
jgi:hypothetical protein